MLSLSLLAMLQGWSPFDITCEEPWVGSRIALGTADRTRPADLDNAGRPFPPLGPSQRLPSSATCLCVVGLHLPNSFADERKYDRRNAMVQ